MASKIVLCWNMNIEKICKITQKIIFDYQKWLSFFPADGDIRSKLVWLNQNNNSSI